MKFILALLSLVATAIAIPQATYSTKFDNVDIDEVLNSNRLFTSYYKCLADTGRCTTEGKELKTILPDALLNNCVKCSEKQKEAIYKIIAHLIKERKEEWKVLQAKYDPDNKYIAKYREQAKAKGIII